MLNNVQLIGNLGKDPEVRHINDERSVANFAIATTESWKDKNGERKSKTEWHNCVAWSPLAGVIEKYAKKGQQVYVQGKLVNSSYEHDGVTKYKTEIEVKDFKLLGKKDSTTTESGTSQSVPSAPSNTPREASSPDTLNDDLPF